MFDRVRVSCVVAMVLMWAAAGCGEGIFRCSRQDQCVDGDTPGQCEANGFCSFPSTSCPSGQRYGAAAGDGLGGECVEDPVADDGSGANGTSMTPIGSGDAGPGTTSGGADGSPTTNPGDSGSGPEEVCDGVDNDLDGLVDEVSPLSADCDDCALFQNAGLAYWFCSAPTPWPGGRLVCQGFGADLAILARQEDDLFVRSLQGPPAWIGATDMSGQWRWVDSSALRYHGFPGGLPSPGGGPRCAHLRGDGEWTAGPCDFPFPIICNAPHAN